MSPPDEYPKSKDKRTEKFALSERVKEFQSFKRQAQKRLDILEDTPMPKFNLEIANLSHIMQI